MSQRRAPGHRDVERRRLWLPRRQPRVAARKTDPIRGNEAFAYSHHKRLVEEMLADYRERHPGAAPGGAARRHDPRRDDPQPDHRIVRPPATDRDPRRAQSVRVHLGPGRGRRDRPCDRAPTRPASTTWPATARSASRRSRSGWASAALTVPPCPPAYRTRRAASARPGAVRPGAGRLPAVSSGARQPSPQDRNSVTCRARPPPKRLTSTAARTASAGARDDGSDGRSTAQRSSSAGRAVASVARWRCGSRRRAPASWASIATQPPSSTLAAELTQAGRRRPRARPAT